MNKIFLMLVAFAVASLSLQAAVPQMLNYQGRMAVNGVDFDGSGQFKFALVNSAGTTTYWSNDGSSTAGEQPTAAVALTVSKGLYAVLLGDATLANMTAVPTSVFDNADVRLRVWFNDGSNGFEWIAPDQRLAASPYALTADKASSTASFTGSLTGDVTGTQSATTISAATVTGKELTGYVSGSGVVSATDTILSAINKLNGNDSLKATLDSPTFTGTVGGLTSAMVGLENVNNTSDASKPVSALQQTALDLKANSASPTFTGTVTGSFSGPLAGNASTATSATNFTGALVGDVTGTQSATVITATTVTGKALTGYVSGTGTVSATDTILSAINKLNGNDELRATLDSPTFSGTVTLPAGTSSVAPLKLATGTNLTTAVLGSVEFDGTNLYLTTNASSPTRKTVTLSDTGSSSQIALTSLVAAPVKPVVAWGRNSNGQTTVPTLANVAAVAAGSAHSLALLDAGTVFAWGLNTSGQTTVPNDLTGVTEIAAGVAHNLVRKSDGTMVAWGSNTYGQTTVPSGITTATKVAAGEKHSLALLANGSVRAWGDNTFGQTTIPSSLTGVTVTAIAAGYDHSLALTASGAVVAWGRSDAGQTSVPNGLTGVVAIAAGAYHSLALKSDGKVVVWGYNSSGQVSNQPSNLSGVSKIAGGYSFSAALKSDGTLVTWGSNTYGQTEIPSAAAQITALAGGGFHVLALRASSIPAQVARLDQDNFFTGNVGIGRAAAINGLEVEGDASKTTAGNWLANSDRRIKTDIESITGALEKIDQVRLVDFRYTEEYRAAHPSIDDIRYPNVIAQEFAKVFPNDVKSSGELMADGSPILQVDTYPLTIYSAAAVQELHRENVELKKKVARLDTKFVDQEKRFADQEKRLRKLEAALAK